MKNLVDWDNIQWGVENKFTNPDSGNEVPRVYEKVICGYCQKIILPVLTVDKSGRTVWIPANIHNKRQFHGNRCRNRATAKANYKRVEHQFEVDPAQQWHSPGVKNFQQFMSKVGRNFNGYRGNNGAILTGE